MDETKSAAGVCKKLDILPSKALIGVLHLYQQLGTPFSRSFIDQLSKRLQEEAALLEASGFNALIVQNHCNGLLHQEGRGGPEMIAAMTSIVLAIQQRVACPLGVQFLDGGNKETLAVAIAAKAQFIKVKGFDTIHGAATLLNYRRNLDAESLPLLAEIEENGEGTEEDYSNKVKNALSFGADGIVLSSNEPHKSVNRELLRQLHSLHLCPLWVGSGVSCDNLIGIWPFADAFVMDLFIREGNPTHQIDPSKLKQVQEVVHHLKHSIA